MDQETLEELIVRRLLPKEAHEQFLKGAISHSYLKPIASHILDLSNSFNSNKGQSAYQSRESCVSYALYYLPINFMKIQNLLSLIPVKLKGMKIRFLDVGSGPGTALFGAMGAGLQFEKIVLCERSPFMKSISEVLLSDHKEMITRLESISDIQGKFDLIVASNVISELQGGEELFVKNLFGLLSPGGAVLLLEPGTFTASRSLMALRDSLLISNPGFIPLFPCTHSKPCPMLSSMPDDWCHGTMSGMRTRLIRDLDELTGFNKHKIKYSAFLGAKGADLQLGYRVIGEPTKDRRGVSGLLCGEDFFGVKTFKANSSDGKRLLKARSFASLRMTQKSHPES